MKTPKDIKALIIFGTGGATGTVGIANDADINAFCLTNFERKPKIFDGIDPRNPPELKTNSPTISITTGGRAREQNQAYRLYGLIIGVGIHKEGQTVSGQVVKFIGSDLMDELSNLVEAKITKILNMNGIASTQDPSIEDETIPPFFKSFWSYALRGQSILPR